jgi:hypothetical protein
MYQKGLQMSPNLVVEPKCTTFEAFTTTDQLPNPKSKAL